MGHQASRVDVSCFHSGAWHIPDRVVDAMREPEPNSPQPGKTGPEAEAEAAALRSRLDALKADLGDAVAQEKAGEASSRGGGSDGGALGTGLRAGSDLAAGVIVGAGIGYLLDRQFGVSPLFLIIFMMVGMAAGFWSVYRLGSRSSVRKPGDLK